MKSYFDFMFFSTVCFSLKRFKCVILKLEDPKNLRKICETPKNSSKICQLRKIGFDQISNPKK